MEQQPTELGLGLGRDREREVGEVGRQSEVEENLASLVPAGESGVALVGRTAARRAADAQGEQGGAEAADQPSLTSVNQTSAGAPSATRMV